jgi:hypothetical protein
VKYKVLKKIRADGKDYFPSSDPGNPTLVDGEEWRWTKKLVDQGKLTPFFEECTCSHRSESETSGGHDVAAAKAEATDHSVAEQKGEPVTTGRGERPRFMAPKSGSKPAAT